MTNFADLEVSFDKQEAGKYAVELRFTLPGSDADTRLGTGAPLVVEFDFTMLQMAIVDPSEYGEMLSKSLFTGEMLANFTQARASAASLQAPLRMRFMAGPNAPEIHTLYWETLRDPQDGSALFTGETLLFSRYLSSGDWRPVNLRPRGSLRAVVAVSNPTDLAARKLAPVDVDGEIARATAALGLIPMTTVGKNERCTVNNLAARLREGCDILYIAAHGTVANNEPRIWLESDDGTADITLAEELVARIRELETLPRLIVLASCQSSGDGSFSNNDTGRVLQALGPRLAQSGVPAVIAMQGNISMESVEKFMPAFFAELQKDGQIDRALAVARGTIREAHDFWMPVLFMRLKSGRVWYVPGVSQDGDEFDKWPGLMLSIKSGQCTPILGPGLYEPFMGDWPAIAGALSREFNFPLSKIQQESLPNVTQYVSVNQDLFTLMTSLDNLIRHNLQRRFNADLPDTLKAADALPLDLLAAAGKAFRARTQFEQHKVLARLPLKIYISTNYDDMMAEALREQGKDPQVYIYRWSERFSSDSVFENDPAYVPSKDKPLVCHLFGHLSNPMSMILTEDDYFEFLINFTESKKRNPPLIMRALTDTALLILGFHLDDWSFRALFRTMMAQQGGVRRGLYSHVGIQLEPDDSRNQNPKRARAYLQKYFGSSQINLYWGKSADFLAELGQRTA